MFELKNFVARRADGQVLPGAFVYLYQLGTTLPVDAFDAYDALLPHPFPAGVDGSITFAAAEGTYHLRVVSGALDTTHVIRFQDESDVVKLTGFQEIEGVKSFTDKPIVPAETFPLSALFNIPPNSVLGRQNSAGVGTTQVIIGGPVLPGTIIYYTSTTPPDGYLFADGSEISRTAASDLFSVIGTYFGDGNGSTTFNIPDLRSIFIRSWSGGGANIPTEQLRLFGTYQAPTVGGVPRDGWGAEGCPIGSVTAGRLVTGSGDGEISEVLESLRSAANDVLVVPGDTRPWNMALAAYIKY